MQHPWEAAGNAAVPGCQAVTGRSEAPGAAGGLASHTRLESVGALRAVFVLAQKQGVNQKGRESLQAAQRVAMSPSVKTFICWQPGRRAGKVTQDR